MIVYGMASVICLATVLLDKDETDAVDLDLRDDGTLVGFTVQCLIVDGPAGYPNQNVTVKLTCPIGDELPKQPAPNQTLIIGLIDEDNDGQNWVVLGLLPGGAARPIPKAAVGLDVTTGGLKSAQVNAPPKGTAVRHYVRGADFTIRLKGAQENFAGEFYLEADDQGNSPDGQNGSFIRLYRVPDMLAAADPTLKDKFCLKLSDATGASIQILNGRILASSPNGQNFIDISDDGIIFKGKMLSSIADNANTLDGNVVAIGFGPLGIPPLQGVHNALCGAMAPMAGTLPQNLSTRVFIGA